MTRWVEEQRETFERDILRDFCRFCAVMDEQLARFGASGAISFPVLSGLIGDLTGKGLLWRLKDNAHLVLHTAGEDTSAGHLLDWTLGYIYHESVKLMEDAHLHQSYLPRLHEFAGAARFGRANVLLAGLSSIQAQTGGSMERETARLKELIALARKLFCLYFSGMAGHRPLARFLYDKRDLVRSVFKEDYALLLREIYGEALDRMYTEAALSLMDSARKEDAGVAVSAALACNPASEAALHIQQLLGNFGQATE